MIGQKEKRKTLEEWKLVQSSSFLISSGDLSPLSLGDTLRDLDRPLLTDRDRERSLDKDFAFDWDLEWDRDFLSLMGERDRDLEREWADLAERERDLERDLDFERPLDFERERDLERDADFDFDLLRELRRLRDLDLLRECLRDLDLERDLERDDEDLDLPRPPRLGRSSIKRILLPFSSVSSSFSMAVFMSE